MARNRRRKREVSTSTPSLTVSRLLPSQVRTPVSTQILQANPLHGFVQDLRTFHPLKALRGAVYSTGGPARLVLKDRSRGNRPGYFGSSQTKAIQAFGSPDKVPICVRRKRRREVLFAKRGGAGGFAKRKRYRRNAHSAIRC